VVEEGALIVPQNSDVKVVVATSLTPDKEIESPASADPPRHQ
jgi:hypothetical protein